MATSFSALRAQKVFRKTLTFAAGAGTGNIGTVAVATMTGTVFIDKVGAVVTTSVTADGAATIELGTTGDTAELIAQTTASTLTAGKNWTGATTDEGVTTVTLKMITGNLFITVATANLTAGVITVVIYYTPATADGYLA